MLGPVFEARPRVPTIGDAIGDLCWLSLAVIGTVAMCSAILYAAAALWVLDPLHVLGR